MYNSLIVNDKSNIHLLHKVDLSESEIVVEKPMTSCNHVIQYTDMDLVTCCLDQVVKVNPSLDIPHSKYLGVGDFLVF